MKIKQDKWKHLSAAGLELILWKMSSEIWYLDIRSFLIYFAQHNVCIHILLLIFIRGDLALFVHLTAGTFTRRVFGFTLWQPLTGSAVRAAVVLHPAGQPTDRLNAPLSHTWSSSYCRRLPRDLWACCSYMKKWKHAQGISSHVYPLIEGLA